MAENGNSRCRAHDSIPCPAKPQFEQPAVNLRDGVAAPTVMRDTAFLNEGSVECFGLATPPLRRDGDDADEMRADALTMRRRCQGAMRCSTSRVAGEMVNILP